MENTWKHTDGKEQTFDSGEIQSFFLSFMNLRDLTQSILTYCNIYIYTSLHLVDNRIQYIIDVSSSSNRILNTLEREHLHHP